MEKEELWHTFATTGRVEDYLRYRGITLPEGATAGIQKEAAAYGDRPKTTSNDRRPDSAGV